MNRKMLMESSIALVKSHSPGVVSETLLLHIFKCLIGSVYSSTGQSQHPLKLDLSTIP